MLNIGNKPRLGLGVTDVFWGNAPSGGTINWIPWEKPAGATFIYIMCIGGGGAGGSGFSSATANARGGGGGGGSGAVTYMMTPAFRLPDVLYVYAGSGAPRSVDANGAGGVGSIVSIAPSNAAAYVVCTASGGGGGGRGTATAAGTAGAAGTLASLANALQLGGLPIFLVGQAGALGGLHSNGAGANVTYPTTGLFISGGAGGGGGTTSNGGAVLQPASQTGVLLLSPGSANGVGGDPPTAGGMGVNRWPLIAAGGGGGGAGLNGPGAPGGDGGFGSGGGGGGAGNGSNTGGAGGPGVVVICAI